MEPDELKKILGNAETSVDNKVKLIIGRHNAAVRGLKQNNGELIGENRKLKEKITGLGGKITETEAKQKELRDELAKASPEEHKKYYDSQLAEIAARHQTELKEVSEERDKFRESHFERLRDDAINAGTKDIPFIDGLKDGFIARVLMMNKFEPKELDGKTAFLNQSNETIEQVMRCFSLTGEGKAYIKSISAAGGAAGVPAKGIVW